MLAGLSANAAFAVLQRSGDLMQTKFESSKTMTRDVERFRAAAAKIETTEDLLKDRKTLQFVLEAYQLESEVDKRGIILKLLTQEPLDTKSLANRLTDQRYGHISVAFGGREDTAPLGDPALVEQIIRQTLTNRFEKSNGESNPGLREAMYFKRVIGSIGSVPEMMIDKALTSVARIAVGLPQQFGLAEFDQQKKMLTDRIDAKDFKDPAWVDRFVARYLAQNGETTAAADPIMTLFGSGNSGTGGILSLLT